MIARVLGELQTYQFRASPSAFALNSGAKLQSPLCPRGALSASMHLDLRPPPASLRMCYYIFYGWSLV